jgi:3-methyladenine DNA glycosylase/8-oxoguanine DNA glycosylase
VYGLDHLPSSDEVVSIAENWRPYRSIATSYLFSAAFDSPDPPPRAAKAASKKTSKRAARK